MLDAYLDESGIHNQAKICVIAGFYGGKGQMKKLETAWENVLADFEFPVEHFHAKDLIKSVRHRPMLESLTKAIKEQKKVHPVSVAIVVDDFQGLSMKQRKWLTGAYLNTTTMTLTTSGCPTKPYFVPFQQCLKIVTGYAPVGGKAHFFFGLDRPFAEYATAMFTLIKKHSRKEQLQGSHWKWKDRLGEPSFPRASETSQLQAADLYVHLTYLHLCQCLSKNWIPLRPTGMLADCIKNRMATSDMVFQDRECLIDSLEKSRQHYGNWEGFFEETKA